MFCGFSFEVVSIATKYAVRRNGFAVQLNITYTLPKYPKIIQKNVKTIKKTAIEAWIFRVDDVGPYNRWGRVVFNSSHGVSNII